MARMSKEELINQVSNYIGDRTDDESVSLLENISDSFSEDTEDWKGKYEENDRQWRERYMSRFKQFTEVSDNTIQPDPPTDEVTVVETEESEGALDYEDLFQAVE